MIQLLYCYCQISYTGVIGNLASLVYGTPAQNTLAILEPPSKIRWGNLAPCGAPLGELGTPRRYNWIAALIWRCQSWLTCVAVRRAFGVLLVVWCAISRIYHGGLYSGDQSLVGRCKLAMTKNGSLFAYSRFAYSRFAYFRSKSGVSPTRKKYYIWHQSNILKLVCTMTGFVCTRN